MIIFITQHFYGNRIMTIFAPHKTLLLISLLIVFISGQAIADPEERRKRFGDRIERMQAQFDKIAAELELSESQKEQVQGIMQQNMPQMREIRRQSRDFKRELMSLDPDSPNYDDTVARLAEAQAELASSRVIQAAETKRAVFSVLSAEQKAKILSGEVKLFSNKKRRLNRRF